MERLDWPCYALDPAWTLCAANAAARSLFVGFFDDGAAPNLLRYVFTHPAARALLPDWTQRAGRLLAEFRRDYSHAMADPRVQGVVERLLMESTDFRVSWEGQAVLAREGGERAFCHPQEGMLHFVQHTLADVERGDFRVVFLQPAQIRSGDTA